MVNMPYFKKCAYKLLLLPCLGFMSALTWSQEAPPVAVHQEDDEIILEEASQNGAASLPPIIFDPVLMQSVELAETDEDGNPRFTTVELSPLPSASGASGSNNLVNSYVNDQDSLGFSIAQFQESILQFELEGGVYDYRLSELYLAMGTNYQQLGEAQLAVDAFSQALQLSRINNGLFTEDQLPVVKALVESYLNLGDISSANLNQEYLLYVTQKIYGAANPIILDELLEYADWNLHAASLSLGYIPNLQSMYFRTESFNEANFIQHEQVENLLSVAAFAYSQAIMMQHDLEAKFDEISSSENVAVLKDSLNLEEEDFNIAETEQKLAYTYFLQYQFDWNNVAVNSFGEAPSTYFLNSDVKGREALERRYAYLQNTNGPALDVVQALLDIADWYLLFERWTSAERLYAQAFDLMEANDIEKIDGLRYPDLPVYIPSFLSPLYSRESNRLPPEEVLEYQGYIDVSFTLSRFARPTAIRLISSSEGTTIATERALLRNLRSAAYRRQLDSESEYAENTYLMRYYYTVQLPDEE